MTDNKNSCGIGLDPIKIGELTQAVKDTRKDVGDLKMMLTDELDKQDVRIRTLENGQAKILGVAIGASAIIGFAIKLFF
jgi:hypothetical protein